MTEPEHSPKGGSSAERWLNCPGSNALLRRLQLPKTDEPEYLSLGTAAHAANAHCLHERIDAWEVVGMKFEKHEVDQPMADAMQVYLDYCRPFLEQDASTCWIEERFGDEFRERPHKDFYGRIDFGALVRDHLTVVDYKHGEGIAVDVEYNPQLMYYAFGLLRRFSTITTVRLVIVQPRAFHPDGVIREWEIDAATILKWAEDVLIPGMHAADVDDGLQPGEWCRFCPAKLACPALVGMFGAAVQADARFVAAITDERLGLEWSQIAAVNNYIKALKDETLRRQMTGVEIPLLKVVPKRAIRVYKVGAEREFVREFGEEALTKPELKTPAEMEKIGPRARELVKQWAYSPSNGYTTALLTDPKPAVKIPTLASRFSDVAESLEPAGDEAAGQE